MSTPPVVTLFGDGEHYRGDSIKQFSIGPIVVSIDGAAPTSLAHPCVSCKLQFRTKDGDLGYALSSSPTTGEGTITITSAAAWTFVVPDQAFPLEEGKWFFDFETTDSTGFVKSYFQGTLTVKVDRSYD